MSSLLIGHSGCDILSALLEISTERLFIGITEKVVTVAGRHSRSKSHSSGAGIERYLYNNIKDERNKKFRWA